MTSKTLLVALMASSIAFTAMAQEEQNEQQGKTAIKAEELAPKNEVKGDDIDQEITNRKLRAETGSKSKYSISTDWTYNGGTIKDPGSDVRPNVRAASSTP